MASPPAARAAADPSAATCEPCEAAAPSSGASVSSAAAPSSARLSCASMVFGMLLINPYAGFFQSGLVVMFLLVGFSGESAVFAKAAVRAHADAKRALHYP